MGAMATIGLDLAKNVFQVHGVATDGKVLALLWQFCGGKP